MAQFHSEITVPGEAPQRIPASSLESLRGSYSGYVSFTISNPVSPAGAYALTVWVVDETGLTSNQLQDTFTLN